MKHTNKHQRPTAVSPAYQHWIEGWEIAAVEAHSTMKSKAYYNEHDPKVAAWLRELIKANLIMPGDVDERSIEDIIPTELAGYTQCHFFAGIGTWSYALRNAGWSDDRKVWTGSCPCQPFSQAGEGKGFADERHLWPAWFHLIQQCRPDVVFGEQVESKNGRAWLDLVQTDLEASGYAVGALGLCAAGFGAPHIRQRLFFVADASCGRFGWDRDGGARGRAESSVGGFAGPLANADDAQRRPPAERWTDDANGANAGGQKAASGFELCGESGGLGNAAFDGSWPFNGQSRESIRREESVGRPGLSIGGMAIADGNCHRENGRSGEGEAPTVQGINRATIVSTGQSGRAGDPVQPTNGFWADAEWLYCRDEKYRATQPGLFPLAHGITHRVVKLRGIGNGIVAPVAEEFLKAYIESKKESSYHENSFPICRQGRSHS